MLNVRQEDALHKRAEAIRADAEKWLDYIWHMDESFQEFLESRREEEKEYRAELEREEYYAAARLLGHQSINRTAGQKLPAGRGIGKARLDS